MGRNRSFGRLGYDRTTNKTTRSKNWRISSHSPLRIFHENHKPGTCPLPQRGRRHHKSAGTSVPPHSFPVFLPTRSRGNSLKTIIQEMTRRTGPQKFLPQFKFPSSSLCPPQTLRNRTHPILEKSFQTSRLGLPDSQLPIISLPPSSYISVLLDQLWLTSSPPHKRTSLSQLGYYQA